MEFRDNQRSLKKYGLRRSLSWEEEDKNRDPGFYGIINGFSIPELQQKLEKARADQLVPGEAVCWLHP